MSIIQHFSYYKIQIYGLGEINQKYWVTWINNSIANDCKLGKIDKQS